MNIKNLIVGAVLAGAVAVGTVACDVAPYQPAYAVSRTMCGNQYCVVMSDGDLVTVDQMIWNSILYGMVIQSYSGGYRFARGSYSTRSITTVSYSQYRSVRAVPVSSEVSNQRTGNTYNSGGRSYTSSPRYQSSVAAAKSAAKSSSGTRTGNYSSVKTVYLSTKAQYSNNKISYTSSKKSH